jgi:hypothetical protein
LIDRLVVRPFAHSLAIALGASSHSPLSSLQPPACLHPPQLPRSSSYTPATTWCSVASRRCRAASLFGEVAPCASSIPTPELNVSTTRSPSEGDSVLESLPLTLLLLLLLLLLALLGLLSSVGGAARALPAVTRARSSETKKLSTAAVDGDDEADDSCAKVAAALRAPAGSQEAPPSRRRLLLSRPSPLTTHASAEARCEEVASKLPPPPLLLPLLPPDDACQRTESCAEVHSSDD